MPTSQNSNEDKRKAKLKGSAKEPRHSQPKSKDKQQEHKHKDASPSPVGHVVTEEQYRLRVSQKAYGLYEKRMAATHLDDWFEAERLVKSELLAEGQWAASV
jgi:ribosome assembly protein YihI (activator of Der GTPase)